MNERIKYLVSGCLGLIGVGLLIILAPIMPFHDDWWYLTAPNLNFTWRDLLPAKSFWRPFDAMFGGVLGVFPACFPWANKIVIVMAHLLNIVMLDRVLCQFRKDDPMPVSQRIVSVCIMAFSSATVASLVNTDTINQVWCITLGLCGTYFMLKSDKRLYPPTAVGCFFISILIKESGVSWLSVAPLMDYVRTREFKTLSLRAIIGSAILAIYFALRFALQGSLVLSGEEYYAISFAPVKMVFNFCVGTVMGWSAVDGLAFFTGKYLLFGATVILSLAGWMLLSMAALKSDVRENIRRMFIGVLVILAFVVPHCFFKYFHPAELHLYSVVAGVSIFVGCMRISKREKFGVWSGAVCLMTLFAIGWGDKIAEIYDRSRRTESVMNKIVETRISLESSVAFVVKEDPSVHCYSVFSQQVIHGFGENTALRSLNGWRDTKAVVVTPEAVSSLPLDMRVVRLD